MQFPQDVEARFAGDVNVEQNAGGRPGSRDRQQRRAVCKADHLITRSRQHHGKRVADGGIIIDYKNLPAGGGFLAHMPIHQQ